ncbi:diphthine--ammonia ligase [Candidatus Woesearchaeota archaeon]|nr:diphthine--ammonia ligase [Candidatus Woesearchaeota archaeon]
MCGIVGIYGSCNNFDLVISGIKLINYRGKDGYGIFDGEKVYFSDSLNFEYLETNNLVLGHCLHAVVSKIKQPFFGKGIFAVNCEIYNWRELYDKYSMEARNDAELFFLLLENLGVEETLNLIDGDYAGVYIRNNNVHLFRDLIGVKPIWYSLENGFAFASERKVLRKLGYSDIFELNPRELLIYDMKTKEYKFINRGFNVLEEIKHLEYNKLKTELVGYLTNAVARRVPDVKFGLLFSGGIDSAVIALILKKLEVDFTCYFCYASGFGDVKDLDYAKRIAEVLNLDLKIAEVSIDEVENSLPLICKLIESNNVTKVSVALPFYFASLKAREDGVKVIFSGLGSEELFAGYERHLRSADLNKECYYGLLNIYERDLYRDDVITMYNNIELRVPFLDLDLIKFSLSIDGKYKINENGNKVILRQVARDLGLSDEFAFRKKIAAQYGSNFLKAIDKLSNKNKINTKSEYLRQFFDEGNVKLGVLFSSGKDSCYAMYIMRRQNYDIKCLITMKSENKDSYMYHTPNVGLAELQAEALGIPLIMQESSGEKEEEIKDLELALIQAKKKYSIEGIIVGALFSNYQRERVQNIATRLGLKVFTPLWHKDQLLLLNEIVSAGFEVILVHVAADGLDESFLGRKLDTKLISKLIELNGKNGMNVAGEGGEFESLVLDCPIFNKKLKILEAEKKMSSKYSGTLEIKKAELVDK